MEKIPVTFSTNTFDYELIARKKRKALYRQVQNGKVVGYEVHTIRIRDNQEILPSNEDFGMFGWSYDKKEDAVEKFEPLRRNTKTN